MALHCLTFLEQSLLENQLISDVSNYYSMLRGKANNPCLVPGQKPDPELMKSLLENILVGFSVEVSAELQTEIVSRALRQIEESKPLPLEPLGKLTITIETTEPSDSDSSPDVTICCDGSWIQAVAADHEDMWNSLKNAVFHVLGELPPTANGKMVTIKSE